MGPAGHVAERTADRHRRGHLWASAVGSRCAEDPITHVDQQIHGRIPYIMYLDPRTNPVCVSYDVKNMYLDPRTNPVLCISYDVKTLDSIKRTVQTAALALFYEIP